MSLLINGANTYQAGINRISRSQDNALRLGPGAGNPVLDKAIGGVQMAVGQDSMELFVLFQKGTQKLSKMFNDLMKAA